MSIHHEKQQSYTGYTGTSQEPSYEYSQPEEHQYVYTTASQQPYGQQPVQVFVQFSQGQQGWQQPPQPFDGSRIAAALSYAFGWLSGILFLIFSNGNRFVRFHALQSLLFFGGINAFDIVFFWSFAHYRLFSFMPYIQGLSILFFLSLNFIAFIGWLVALFQAARGTYFKLPVVGEIVTRLLQSGPPDMVK